MYRSGQVRAQVLKCRAFRAVPVVSGAKARARLFIRREYFRGLKGQQTRKVKARSAIGRVRRRVLRLRRHTTRAMMRRRVQAVAVSSTRAMPPAHNKSGGWVVLPYPMPTQAAANFQITVRRFGKALNLAHGKRSLLLDGIRSQSSARRLLSDRRAGSQRARLFDNLLSQRERVSCALSLPAMRGARALSLSPAACQSMASLHAAPEIAPCRKLGLCKVSQSRLWFFAAFGHGRGHARGA